MLELALMSADEARACVRAINAHLNGARQLLLDLHDRSGWRALGYDSWRACVVAEFQQSQRHLYRQLEAAQLERELQQAVVQLDKSLPPLPEYHLRQIAQLPPPERREVALAIAQSGNLSIKDHRRIIAEKQRQVALQPRATVVDLESVDCIPSTCQIEVGDARALPLEEGTAHLVVTSPPYNARVAYDGYIDWLPWDEYWDGLITPALVEAYRVLCPGGRLCLNLPNVVRQDVGDGGLEDVAYLSNGGRKWRPAAANGRPWAALVETHLYPLAEEIGFLPRERIQWIKGAEPETVTTTSTAWGSYCSAINPVLRAVGEPIYVFSKERYDRPDRGESDISADEFKRDSRNVWFVPAIGLDPTAFPASFPLDLPQRLIRLYSFVGDLVVDPFVGSGTTILAAAKTGRWAYGCDVSERSVQLARQRVARALVTGNRQ